MCADPSLDHLIRPLQERWRDRQAEGFGGLEVVGLGAERRGEEGTCYRADERSSVH